MDNSDNVLKRLESLMQNGFIDGIKKILQNDIGQSTLNKALVYACGELFYACGEKKLDMIRLLLSKGADFHRCEEELLKLATEESNLEFLKFLISIGVNVKLLSNNEHVGYASSSIVKYLINSDISLSRDMIEAAAHGDNLDTFKLLRSEISDTDLSNMWKIALDNCSMKIFDYLLDILPSSSEFYNLDLYNIIGLEDDTHVFKKLLNRIPDPKSIVDVRYLKTACFFSRYEIAKIILELGIDPNEIVRSDIRLESYQNRTCLECALRADFPSCEVVKLLLDYDANVTSSCLDSAVENEWDIFHLIYQSNQWSETQLSSSLFRTIELCDDNHNEKIWKFLHKEIGMQLESEYLQKIINHCIYYCNINMFEHFVDFYGKETLWNLVSFSDIVSYVLKKSRYESFEYLLKLYGKETVFELLDFSNFNEQIKQYLKKFD